ncbi:MAG: DNA translocase FtsK 4TM domain-containing protein [Bacteroidota bacterium]
MSTEKKTFLIAPEHRGERIILAFLFKGIGIFIMLALFSCMQKMIHLDAALLQVIAKNRQLLDNDLGMLGSMLSNTLIIDLFGVSSFCLPLLFLITSAKLLFPTRIAFRKSISMTLFLLFWSSIAIDYYFPNPSQLTWYNITGHLMHSVASTLQKLIGSGVILFLVLGFLAFTLILLTSGHRKKAADNITEPVMEHGLIPPYKINRANYYAGEPHAELTSAYFASKRSYATQRGRESFHTAAHIALKQHTHHHEPQFTPPTYTQHDPSYSVEIPHDIQPNLALESHAKQSGYKTAHLIFAKPSHDE